MKKLLKAIGVAALIGSIPYAVSKKKDSDDLKIHALLWNAKVFTNDEGEKHIDVKVGFSNPFAHECCCGGECHCHDGEDECCCEAEEESCCCEEETADEYCCEEQREGTCCCEETPVENPEEN